jgi:tRNA(fMet)-specific endonuclease VapC
MVCLDTTVLIDLRRGRRNRLRQNAEDALLRFVDAGDAICTTRINEAEFRVGIFLSRDSEGERVEVERLLSGVQILEFDAVAATQFAVLKAEKIRIGRHVGDLDLVIAAIAMANSVPLLTGNAQHFAEIPGLVVHSY